MSSICAHVFFFFSSRRRHTRFKCDWSSDVCSSDLLDAEYTLPVEFEVSEFQLARWISSDDRKKLEAFILANGSGVADDVDGDPVFLAKNEFYLGYVSERAEGIAFSTIKDVKKKGGGCVPPCR